MPELYEIRIRGGLSDATRSSLADAIGGLEPAETVMRAPIADQAQLRGIIARLHELGCELIAARPISPRRGGRR
jgi:hypothetical protein